MVGNLWAIPVCVDFQVADPSRGTREQTWWLPCSWVWLIHPREEGFRDLVLCRSPQEHHPGRGWRRPQWCQDLGGDGTLVSRSWADGVASASYHRSGGGVRGVSKNWAPLHSQWLVLLHLPPFLLLRYSFWGPFRAQPFWGFTWIIPMGQVRSPQNSPELEKKSHRF